MPKESIQKILQHYGYADVRVLGGVQTGYRNHSHAVQLPNGQTLNLIIYKREPGIVKRIQNANYVADFLAGQGLPARRSADQRILKLYRQTPQYAALYQYLPGATIPWEAYTMEHLKLLGAMMSDMHASLSTLPQKNLPPVIDECLILWEGMERYFTDKGVQQALQTKLNLAVHMPERLSKVLQECRKLPAQALHMDFVRGNILFDESKHISGILDFEKAAWGNPLFDIARTLAFLLVDCKYKEAEKVRKYFLYSGYQKRGKAPFSSSKILGQLVDFFLLYDCYKFLKHNPYESLKDNEHFVRTRDFLLQRKIITNY